MKDWRSFTKSTRYLLEAREVSFVRQSRNILGNISFTLQTGEHTVILGKNGSGKSTLVNLLYGTEWPTSGQLLFDGQAYGQIPIREIQKKTAIVQSAHQSASVQSGLTAGDIIMTGLFGTIGYYQEPSPEQQDKVSAILREHKLEYLENRPYSTLSDGEKKKILLLRAVINNPSLLVLDEPCSSFDIAAREDFFSILDKCRETSEFSSVLITHRLDEIPPFYTKGILLKEGEILAWGQLEDILTGPLVSRTYGLPLEVVSKNGRHQAMVISKPLP